MESLLLSFYFRKGLAINERVKNALTVQVLFVRPGAEKVDQNNLLFSECYTLKLP